MPDRNGRLTPDEIREAGQLAQRMASEQGLDRPTGHMIQQARSAIQNRQPHESDSAILGPGVQRPPVDGPEAREGISFKNCSV